MSADIRDRLARVYRDTIRPRGGSIVLFDRSLRDLGTDSLSVVLLLAGIYDEFRVHLATEGAFTRHTLDDIVRMLEARLAADAPRQASEDPSDARVPALANRYSYFLKKERRLERWNVVSRVYRLRPPIDLDALVRAAGLVVARHDGLRLRLAVEDGVRVEQFVAAPEETRPLRIVDVPESASRATFIAAEVRADQEATSLGTDLFRVLVFRCAKTDETWFVVVAHHALVDGFSFRLVMNDLAEAYATGMIAPAGSFRRYAIDSVVYWTARAPAVAGSWLARPWAHVRPLLAGGTVRDRANVEAHTTQVVRVIDECATLGSRLEEIVLAAIGRAFRRWTGHDALHLALVVHGRTEDGLTGSLARTVGWISETVPIVLPLDADAPALLVEARVQLEEAAATGRAFGVLRHLAPPSDAASAVRALPEAEISLNIDLGAPFTDRGQRIERDNDIVVETLVDPTTQRAFLLSGGVFRRDGALRIAWDFSSRLFATAEIERFTDMCREEVALLRDALESAL